MPEIGRLLGAGASQVQLTLSAYLIGIAVGQVIYGPVSDHYGRKPVLLAALALFCFASALCAAAPDIETLIAARALQALGGSGATVLPRAIVRDLYTAERAGLELSRIGAIMSVAPVIAPLVGALVQIGFGWRANFVVIMAVGLIATISGAPCRKPCIAARSNHCRCPASCTVIVRSLPIGRLSPISASWPAAMPGCLPGSPARRLFCRICMAFQHSGLRWLSPLPALGR
jgi:multidrug resistance protein